MDSPHSQPNSDYSESRTKQHSLTDHLLLSSQLDRSEWDNEVPGIGAQPLEPGPGILRNENEPLLAENISTLIGSMYETELALMTPKSRKHKADEMVNEDYVPPSDENEIELESNLNGVTELQVRALYRFLVSRIQQTLESSVSLGARITSQRLMIEREMNKLKEMESVRTQLEDSIQKDEVNRAKLLRGWPIIVLPNTDPEVHSPTRDNENIRFF